MRIPARGKAWLAFLFVVFGLYNCGITHEHKREIDLYLEQHGRPRDVVQALHFARSYFLDDGDVRRYLSYANAALGKPYIKYYVRGLNEWLSHFSRYRSYRDFVDPSLEIFERLPPQVPYRDYLVEYPPGFFLIALPPVFISADEDVYRVLFCSLMGVLLLLAVLLCQRIGRVAPSLAVRTHQLLGWSALGLLAVGTVATHRYDAVVSFLLCLSAWACLAARPLLLGLGLSLGVLTKVVPAFLAPAFAIYLIRTRSFRSLALAAASTVLTMLALLAPVLALAGLRLFDMLRYHGQRPVQVESTWAAWIGLLRALGLTSAEIVDTHGAFHLSGPLVAPFSKLAMVLPILATVALYGLIWVRLGREDLDRPRTLLHGLVSILIAQMIFGKVFSPQYLIWLIPLGVELALVAGGPSLPILLLTLALTQIIFPIAYSALLKLHPLMCLVLLLRNLLLGYWAWALLSPRAARRRPG